MFVELCVYCMHVDVQLTFYEFSVVGLNFDFLLYNFIGFLAYSFFNAGMLWVDVMKVSVDIYMHFILYFCVLSVTYIHHLFFKSISLYHCLIG